MDAAASAPPPPDQAPEASAIDVARACRSSRPSGVYASDREGSSHAFKHTLERFGEAHLGWLTTLDVSRNGHTYRLVTDTPLVDLWVGRDGISLRAGAVDAEPTTHVIHHARGIGIRAPSASRHAHLSAWTADGTVLTAVFRRPSAGADAAALAGGDLAHEAPAVERETRMLVRVRGVPLDEAVVRYARRRAEQLLSSSHLRCEVLVDRSAGAKPHVDARVLLVAPDGPVGFAGEDADPILAVRNAFELAARYASAYAELPSEPAHPQVSSLEAPAGGSDESDSRAGDVSRRTRGSRAP